MTIQTLVPPASIKVERPQPSTSAPQSAAVEKAKSLYQIDQQVELLHLQADIEALLQQLQSLKNQRDTLV